MFNVSSAQLEIWLALYAYPAIRVLALLAAVPVYNNAALPRRVRLFTGLAIAGVIAVALPVSPQAASPGSVLTLAGIACETLIGYAIGFSIRVVFAAIDLAGDLIGLQMGLSFAQFYDPQAAGQTTVLSRFLGLISTLCFLSINGHLLVIDVIGRSFEWLPPGGTQFVAAGFRTLAQTGTVLYATGLMIALPLVTALLITNVALGVLTRAAPQLNLFALGFPITLGVGLAGLYIVLPLFAPAFESLYERAFGAVDLFIRVAAGR